VIGAAQSLEERLIAHIRTARFEDLDSAALRALSIFTLDSLGVGIAGSRVGLSEALRNAVHGWGDAAPGTGARVWHSGHRLPAPQAAMVNAYQIHNQEFDCVHEAAVVHPMAVILASLLASAERCGGASGRDFAIALAVAVDVATVLGMCASQPMRFFRPGMCGALGAIAGLARLEGLTAEQLWNALGIGYSHLGGTMQAHKEGSTMLPLQVALNARNALAAVDLAKAGFDGPHAFLSGPFGFFTLMEDAGNAEAAFAQLGQVWQVSRISHKPFPTGRAAHGGLDGIATLRVQHGFAAADIVQITVAAPPLVRRLVDRPAQAGMGHNYAKLCLGYVASCLLLDGEVSLDSYLPEQLNRQDHLALAQRVRMVANDCVDPNALAPQTVTIELRDARCLSVELPAVLGHPERPLSLAQHLAKFAACCDASFPPLPSRQQQALIAACDGLADLQNVCSLTELTLSPSS